MIDTANLEGAGLSIDMTDADRLRDWARNLLLYGPDVTHWASVPHLASRLQLLATDIEKTVKDIGALRAIATHVGSLQVQNATLRSALVGLVGVDGRAELEQMEVFIRAAVAPAADKAATIDAIHALIAVEGRCD